MKPTDEQIKWFWEQCGLTVDYSERHICYYVYSRDGKELCSLGTFLDLNNLFKYAVPKLLHWHIQRVHLNMANCFASVQRPDRFQFYDAYDNDPALALFWACFKALGGNE